MGIVPPSADREFGKFDDNGFLKVSIQTQLSQPTFIAANPQATVNIAGLISLASGTKVEVSTSSLPTISIGNIINALATVTPASQLPLVTGSNYIGLATVTPASQPPLVAGSSYVGLVSVSGNVAVSNFPVTQAVSFGLVSLASGTEVRSLATILNFPSSQAVTFTQPALVASSAYIGLVSVSGTVGLSGLISLASGTEIRSLATILNFPATQAVSFGLVSLASGTEIRSLATILGGSIGITGLVSLPSGTQLGGITSMPSINASVGIYSAATIFAVVNTGAVGNTNSLATLLSGPNQIGSVTISNTPAVSQSGNWDIRSMLSAATLFAVVNTGAAGVGNSMVTINPRTDYIGLMSISGNVVNLAGANYIGLASVNIGGTLPALNTGANYVGLASVNIGGTLPALVAGSAYVGLVSVSGTVGVSGLISLASGTLVGLNPSANFIGLATVVQGNQPALVASSAYIGLTTTTLFGTPTVTLVPHSFGFVSSPSIQIKSGAGMLNSIVITAPSMPTTTFYDSIAATGVVLAQFLPSPVTGTYTFQVGLATGLTAISTAGIIPKYTVSYK